MQLSGIVSILFCGITSNVHKRRLPGATARRLASRGADSPCSRRDADWTARTLVTIITPLPTLQPPGITMATYVRPSLSHTGLGLTRDLFEALAKGAPVWSKRPPRYPRPETAAAAPPLGAPGGLSVFVIPARRGRATGRPATASGCSSVPPPNPPIAPLATLQARRLLCSSTWGWPPSPSPSSTTPCGPSPPPRSSRAWWAEDPGPPTPDPRPPTSAAALGWVGVRGDSPGCPEEAAALRTAYALRLYVLL